MKQRWIKLAKSVLFGTVMLGLLSVPSLTGSAYDAGTLLLPQYDAVVPSDCALLGVRGAYITEAQAALQRINEIRLEACEQGVRDPRDGVGSLTPEDYVPVKWSRGLETVARIRAAEASLYCAHQRPNGGICWEVTSDLALYGEGEELAWNYSGTMLQGIEQWYEEKQAWVNRTPNLETGHYTAMIDPSNTYVGLGCMLSENGAYYNTTCGRFGKSDEALDMTQQAAVQDCIQPVVVKQSALGTVSLKETSGNSSTSLQVGETRAYECMVQTHFLNRPAAALVLNPMWTSSAPNVARVDSFGAVQALDTGMATITASGSGFTASVTLTVSAKVTSVVLPASKKLTAGKSVTLKATVNPANATDKSLSWTSSNKKVATVSGKGKVTAKKPGKAVITAAAKDGSGKKASCTVIVLPKKLSAPTLRVPGRKKLKISWKKQSGVSGYQVQYGLKKSFKGAKLKKVSSSKASLTVSNLKKNKTYYVRVRAYKKISGKTYYGSWSIKKKVKIKK